MNNNNKLKEPPHLPVTPLRPIFPEVKPYETGMLAVDAPHKLYWEQSGNPDGVPIVFVHGGPGGGASPAMRRFFDPAYYRIILFDQRGCGKSTPHSDLTDNNRAALVRDMESLRKHLDIARWHVFGGSWGSTLALSYAQAHPEPCMSLILRGIFLLEAPEIEWFMTGMGQFYPEAAAQFNALYPEIDPSDSAALLARYYQDLCNDDPAVHTEPAIRWSLYESACAALISNIETITTDEEKRQALALARLEAHYFVNDMIAPEESLLNFIDKIRHIPATIIQGRYDVICPIRTANRLHHAWPEADYVIVPDGGHASMDPAVRSRLIEATENAKTLS